MKKTHIKSVLAEIERRIEDLQSTRRRLIDTFHEEWMRSIVDEPEEEKPSRQKVKPRRKAKGQWGSPVPMLIRHFDALPQEMSSAQAAAVLKAKGEKLPPNWFCWLPAGLKTLAHQGRLAISKTKNKTGQPIALFLKSAPSPSTTEGGSAPQQEPTTA